MGPPLEQFFAGVRPAIPAPPQVTAESNARTVAIVIVSLLVIAGAVWFKIRLDEQAEAEARGERIREDVRRSIQESLSKQQQN
jgi:hypothetical protein